jgi:hypothetical protein
MLYYKSKEKSVSIYYAPKEAVEMKVGDLVKDRWGTVGVLVKFIDPIEVRWLVHYTNGKQYGANQDTLELVSAS